MNLNYRKLTSYLSAFIFFLLIIYIWKNSTLTSPGPTPIIEDANGKYLTEGSGDLSKLGYWSFPGKVPERVEKALISIEDKRFYSHNGIDLKAILRVIRENLFNNGREGGSTLPMQVVRIQKSSRRNAFNKGIEALTATLMIHRYGHEKVLRHYMKIVPMGRRMHGFSYAARRYFKKPIEDLSWAEASLLAGLPKAPGRMNLFRYRGMKYAVERGSLVLKRLLNQGYITAHQYTESLDEIKEFKALGIETRPTESYHYILRLNEEFQKREIKNINSTTRSTLDGELQVYLRDYINSTFSDLAAMDADNIAVIVADKTGSILGYIGSQNYYNKKHHGFINYANTRRSSGSTLKPFLYVKGLDTGDFTPGSIVDDLPIQIMDGKGSFVAANFDDNFLGPMLYRTSLANSRNIPSVRILESIGLSRIYDYFYNLNFVHKDRSPSYYGYGMIIGGLYVTLEDLVKAYGSLATDGKRYNLRWFENDTHENGISAGTPYATSLVGQFLSDPIARLPSFNRLGPLEYPYPVAIKTGTSQGFRDAWVLAYSSEYIVGLWLGRHDNKKMNHVSGGTAAKTLKPIMDYLHRDAADGINQKSLTVPENVRSTEICPLSGLLATKLCNNKKSEYFRSVDMPVDPCNVHQLFAIDNRDGSPATHSTPPGKVGTKVFTILPSRYSAWASRKGFNLPQNRQVKLEKQVEIRITEPVNNVKYIYDYETPPRFQSIALRAEITPVVPELQWYVDGKHYKTVKYPYQTRLELTPGEHTLEARVDKLGEKSQMINIFVD